MPPYKAGRSRKQHSFHITIGCRGGALLSWALMGVRQLLTNKFKSIIPRFPRLSIPLRSTTTCVTSGMRLNDFYFGDRDDELSAAPAVFSLLVENFVGK